MKTQLILLRHGEPILKQALLGRTDSPLSEKGWQQLESASANFENIQQVITSPLSRCAAFAQMYAAENAIPLSIQSDWRECDFGDWDGQTYQSLHQHYPEQFSSFLQAPQNFMPPQGESLVDFSHRVENALMSLLKAHSGKKILLVTHGGVIRTLVAWCLKMPILDSHHFRRFSVDYASTTEMDIHHDYELFPQLRVLNASERELVS